MNTIQFLGIALLALGLIERYGFAQVFGAVIAEVGLVLLAIGGLLP